MAAATLVVVISRRWLFFAAVKVLHLWVLMNLTVGFGYLWKVGIEVGNVREREASMAEQLNFSQSSGLVMKERKEL